MSGGIKRTPRKHTHDQIPRAALRDARLSYRARGVHARLLTNADDYSMTAEQIAREGKEGRGAILSALRQLRAAGYVRTERRREPNGHWMTETYVYEEPQPPTSTEVRFSDSGFSNVGFPNVGSSAPKSRQAPTEKKKQQQDQGAGESSAAAPSKERERKLRRTHFATGVIYWYDSEPNEIERTAEEYGLEAVRAAVAALKARGAEPLHRPVADMLRKQRAAELDKEKRRAEAEKAAREAAEREARLNDPEAQARVNALLDAHRKTLGIKPQSRRTT